MTSVDMNVGIYEKFKKPNEFTPTPTTPPIPKSEAKLSYLLRGNVVDDVTLLQPADFVKEKKPLRVYVSSLLRTWETAFLLFLSFLINSTYPEYIPVLVLVVSPFLREEENKGINASNIPGKIVDNIMQFLKFIDLYILLSNLEDDRDKFKSYPKKFNLVVEFSSTQKLYIHVDTTTPSYIVFEYQIIGINSTDTEIKDYLKTRVSLSDQNIRFIKSIVSSVSNVASSSSYVKYNDTLSTPTPTQVELPYALTQMDESNFDNFETFSVYSPDIFNYLKWVISVKKHPKNIPIFVVSHSGTMKKFLKKIFFCFNKGVKNITPSSTFIKMYEYCTNTNVWSFRLNYMGYSVIVFRHGFTCDNMYKEGSIILARLNGYYSNLSIWGICSIIKFYELKKEILINLTDIRESILSIMPGFQKQTEISKEDLPNEITCGSDIDSRFNNKNTGNKILNFNCTSSTNLEKYMQPMRVNSVLDSDIDKDIQELISIEFTYCPNTGRKFLGQTLGSTFGCIKLTCVYNGRYVIIRPYTNKETSFSMYEISFYDTSNEENKGLIETKHVKIDSSLKNILEYEKMLVFLFNYESKMNDSSIIYNFNISSVVHILMNTTMPRVIEILKTSTNAKIDVPDAIYST
jgi:hypothetical protein